MSGLSKASFDPLMNPGAAAASPVDEDNVAPVGGLSRMGLGNQQASKADEDEDVPAQSMSEFLGESADSSAKAPAPAATNALLAQLDPAATRAAAELKAKRRALFDTDEEDPLEELLKAKERDAAHKQDSEQQQAAEAARKEAFAAAEAAAAAQKAALKAGSDVPAGAVSASVPPAASVGSRRANSSDLFGAVSGDSDARHGGLGSVFIPTGAAEYRSEADKARTEDVDPALLEERDDEDLDRLAGGTAVNQASAAAADSTAQAAAANANSASGAAAAAAAEDELDDDLFSFSVKPAATSAASAVDPAAPGFDLNAYLASQKTALGGAAKSTGASLFDDDDD